MGVAQRFYDAFTVRDHYTMGLLYAEHATFSDPVFQLLNAKGTRLMWQMLMSRAEDDFGIDYDVLEDGVIVGRIFKVPIAPKDQPWMWASGHNGDYRRAAHGYEATREAAMAAFAKSWRR